MDDRLREAIPEIGRAEDPKAVPWAEAVVWCQMPPGPGRTYEWLLREHIRYVTWTNGIVSVSISSESFLSKTWTQLLVTAPLIWVGSKVPTG